MKVYELTIKAYLLKDIEQKDLIARITEVIDKALSNSEFYLEYHKKNTFKNYCYNGFYPVEIDKLYKTDNIYTFQIRTIDIDLFKYLTLEINNIVTNHIKVLKSDIKIINPKHIDKIYSITPLVMKTELGYWKGNVSLESYENRIKSNLIKKYNMYYGEKIEEDFPLFTAIEFKNIKPVTLSYKGKKILGDKVSLQIADDEISQKIAFMAIGTGIGEMNGRGLGYVNYRWL